MPIKHGTIKNSNQMNPEANLGTYRFIDIRLV